MLRPLFSNARAAGSGARAEAAAGKADPYRRQPGGRLLGERSLLALQDLRSNTRAKELWR